MSKPSNSSPTKLPPSSTPTSTSNSNPSNISQPFSSNKKNKKNRSTIIATKDKKGQADYGKRPNSEVEFLNINDAEVVAPSTSLSQQTNETGTKKTSNTSGVADNNNNKSNNSQDSQHQLESSTINNCQSTNYSTTLNRPLPPTPSSADKDSEPTNSIRADSEAGLGSRSESTRRLMADGFQGHLTKNLIWAVFASAVGSSFQHGYNGGVVNAPEKLIAQFINETYHKRYQEVGSDAQIDFIFAIIVSIFCIGGCIGAMATAFVADRIGRKEGLFYNNFLALIACPLMALSKSLDSYELLIIGRLIIGINAGLNAGLAPLYLNEISPINLRGALGTIYQLVITISVFLSNIFGMPALFGTETLWPLLFIVPLLPAAFMLSVLPKYKESPKFLLLNQGKELQAQQALAWFRETTEVQDEMDDLRAENEIQKMSPPITLNDLLTQISLRKPLTISIVIMLSQQFSGINAVLFFSTSIFRSAGLSEHSAIQATLGMSLVNVLMTIVSLFLVDRAGRKTLHMTGLMGMAITCVVLALCLGSGNDGSSSNVSSVLAVISVYVFIIMFASGPGSIPWFLVSELFPSNARPLASSIAVAVNWFANFTVSLCFLPLSNILHGYIFLLFAFLLIIFFLFTYYKVPETKGVTAEEISALFKR